MNDTDKGKVINESLELLKIAYFNDDDETRLNALFYNYCDKHDLHEEALISIWLDFALNQAIQGYVNKKKLWQLISMYGCITYR